MTAHQATNPKRSFGEQTRMLALRTAICQGARIVRLEGGPKLSVSGFACMPSFSSGGILHRQARVQSQVEPSEPKGNLDGVLARLHHSEENEGFGIQR